MFKNATPTQLAFFAAAVISFAFFLSSYLYSFLAATPLSFWTVLLLTAVMFFLSFATFFYSMRWYIYRKVKLIYKNIHSQKLSGNEKLKMANMDEDILSEVEREVSEWAEGQKKEIAQLKLMEDYRRNFVGNVSHELKTPLFAVQGYIHTLLEGGLYDEAINFKFLSKANKNVHRLQTIVEDLDTIAQLESGQILLEQESFSIRELVLEVFEDLELVAKENDISLQFKEGTANNYEVFADRENIRQVLVNLIFNSIKYGKKDGQTQVSFYDMHNNILVEISDNGPGIPQKHLAHLFDRFYRVDKSRARNAGGSGLGLAIVKHIIEAHRQTVNVRSREDLGSTFGFTLKKG